MLHRGVRVCTWQLLLTPLFIAIADGADHGAADDDSAPIVSLDVDWPSFLRRHDPVWNWSSSPAGRGAQKPPDQFYEALFGGNAMLGFMLWQPTNRTVRLDISRADVYDDRTPQSTPDAWTNDFVYDQPRLPIGHFELTFSAPVRGALGRLSLWGAEASYNVSTADGETCELRAFAPSPTAASARPPAFVPQHIMARHTASWHAMVLLSCAFAP